MAADLGVVVREAAAGVKERAETLAQLPRIGWAVATDEATVEDLTNDELAFRTHPGEHIEITQMQRGRGEPRRLLRLPPDSDLDLPLMVGTHLVVRDNHLHLVTVVNIEPRDHAESMVGLLAVAKQLDTSAIEGRLGAHGMSAEVRTIQGSVALAGHAPTAGTTTIPVPGPAATGVTLVAANRASARWPYVVAPLVLILALGGAGVLWRREAGVPSRLPLEGPPAPEAEVATSRRSPIPLPPEPEETTSRSSPIPLPPEPEETTSRRSPIPPPPEPDETTSRRPGAPSPPEPAPPPFRAPVASPGARPTPPALPAPFPRPGSPPLGVRPMAAAGIPLPAAKPTPVAGTPADAPKATPVVGLPALFAPARRQPTPPVGAKATPVAGMPALPPEAVPTPFEGRTDQALSGHVAMQLPRTGSVSLPPRPTGAPAAPSDPGADADPRTEEYRGLFAEFVKLRKTTGEPVENLDAAQFVETLREKRAQIMKQQAVRDVKFKLAFQNGKAAIRFQTVT